MTAAARPWARELLHFWFAKLGPGDRFGGSDAIDAELARRFEADWRRMRSEPAGSFLTSSATARAAILLFDQVPRNIFRGSAKAFASDPLALSIAKAFLGAGLDRGLPEQQRLFAVMPFMHSEDIADQRFCVAYFARYLPRQLSFARDHHAMIARFGRYPHRNAVLGRTSTPAEKRAIEEGFSW